MISVYVVSSGYQNPETDMFPNMLVLKAFADKEKAEAWIESEIARDPSYNEDYDHFQIDTLTLEE
jgi:hypothetical protein